MEKTVYDSKFKNCYSCNERNIPKTKINCPQCKKNLKKSQIEALGIPEGTYEKPKSRKQGALAAPTPKALRVEFDELSQGRYKVKMSKIDTDDTSGASQIVPVGYHVAQPIFVNPCSYDACLTILRELGRKACIRKYGLGDREWVSVCCDGSPYVLCLRIIQSTYMCNVCKESANGIAAMEIHMEQSHCEAALSYSLEFDWVHLVPGTGHVEMNLVRTIVEFCWDIFWRDMAYLMNFKSENALRACKRVSDHHKGWQLLKIARVAISKELVLPFVRSQMAKGDADLSVVNFMRFISRDVCNSNYLMMADIVFEILDSTVMFREGVRNSNQDFMIAGRAKVAKLWTARHHPSYREIEMADSLHQGKSNIISLVIVKWQVHL